MRKSDFVTELAASLDLSPSKLQPETVLSTIAMWDSVAYLTTMLLIDEKLGMTVRPEVLSGAVTLADILGEVEAALDD